MSSVAVSHASSDSFDRDGGSARLDQRDAIALGAILMLTAVVFANGLLGGFVLDDQKQIVRNDLIRSPRFWGEALTRDVWAFQGERDTPWSNYWRPGHVAWLILNYQLFGANPLPWHVTNLLAHLGAVACAYVVLRRLGATLGVAATIGAIFAIHPTRVESVTWIAGVHDVLAALYQLLALICLTSTWRSTDRAANAWRWAAAIALYVLAVTTKEIAIFFPILVALVRYTDPDLAGSAAEGRVARAVRPAIPFVVIAGIFLAARFFVLGRAQMSFPGQPGYGTVLVTLPLVLAYYLRQIVFPYWIGWSYPVRAIGGDAMGPWNFALPLSIVTAAFAAALALVRGRLAVIGAAIFALTLLPALNIRALHPEQLVKDRYLYLPLLGFLMVVVPPLAHVLIRALGAPRARIAGGAIAAIVVLLLSVRTVQYNFAWRAERPLWQWAVWNDPGSATNHELLATAFMHEGPERYADARHEYARALELYPALTDAYVNRAELNIRERRFEDAIADCRKVLERFPDNTRALERLIIALEGQGRLEQAAAVCREAREKAPYRHAVFTDKLAVILVKQGRKPEALAELESARASAESDFSPGSRMVLFHLGMLYGELGRRDEAAGALRRFLELTEGTADPNLVPPRRAAEAALRRVGL